MASKTFKCSTCDKNPLDKDEVAICKKILGRNIDAFYCLDCLAADLQVSKEDLLDKIEYFKNEGCVLFK